MKKFLVTISILGVVFLATQCSKDNTSNTTPTATDSFQVSVVNGYGNGIYKVGDTVHIFSRALASNEVFATWIGNNLPLLNASTEWHTWFIMPAQNVTFTGSTQSVTPYTLQSEKIMGVSRMKPVYSYFPSNQKGVVFLLHGTGGNAANIVNSYEWQLMMRDLINNNFAVIITESEESTAGVDLNGDGQIRWNLLPWDTTTNVDFQNIKIITNTFINRGTLPATEPRYSIGMSNGGNFSTGLSTIYRFKTGVSYCAPSGTTIAAGTITPLQFCMARFDNNPDVGPTGNANALQNNQTLTSRGICSKYFIKERAPLYPERFARDGSISITQSTAIYNEIKAFGFLDARNYFKGYATDLQSAMQNNTSAFPTTNGLTPAQQLFVTQQISLSVSDHQMYSDFNKTTIKFLTTQCQ
ncbi:MAG: hypothetical protein JST94_10960 [Bacteroidetes bacterium]|nr:hypothetical protein [Bacteroidota bacterium]MBS1590763.1 hypothetical protein [Bacteroidota bacterium]MBS1638812.1 hypothetical protein [Bacteroidota bacterium]MBS1671949.1 hypothetical protein [Bacteroidota bacterium]